MRQTALTRGARKANSRAGVVADNGSKYAGAVALFHGRLRSLYRPPALACDASTRHFSFVFCPQRCQGVLRPHGLEVTIGDA
jgi:hypothetical protein